MIETKSPILLPNKNPTLLTRMNKENNSPNTTLPCPGCGGSGQTSFFAGESRFMLTWEDCPDCCGTGILLTDAEHPDNLPMTEEKHDTGN